MFETLKKRLHEKFLKTTRKVDMDGEIVYFKRVGLGVPFTSKIESIKEWSRVYPPVSEDGTKWIWKNLLFGGSNQAFIRSTAVFILVLLGFFAFKEYTNSLTAFLQQPEVQNCLQNIGYKITG